MSNECDEQPLIQVVDEKTQQVLYTEPAQEIIQKSSQPLPETPTAEVQTIAVETPVETQMTLETKQATETRDSDDGVDDDYEDDPDDPNIIHLTPEEEEILRRDFGYIANVFKKNLSIIVQEVTFPNDPRGDLIIDHSFKPELDENGLLKEVKYSLLFWKSGLNHRRAIPPEHAILIVLSLLENHETTPQFMFECGQNIKVAYGQLPTNLWAYAILISRLEDMDFDEGIPDESELSTRKRYRETYIKYVNHFRKIAKETIETKGKQIPVFPEYVDPDLAEFLPALTDLPENQGDTTNGTKNGNKEQKKRGRPPKSEKTDTLTKPAKKVKADKPNKPDKPPKPTKTNTKTGSGKPRGRPRKNLLPSTTDPANDLVDAIV